MRVLLALLIFALSFNVYGQEPAKKPWMIETRARMIEAGVYTGYNDRWGHRRELTRYEMAVEVHATAEHLLELMQGRDPRTPENLALLKKAKPLIPDLKRLTVELRRELVSLGVPYNTFYNRFDTIAVNIDALLSPAPVNTRVYRKGEEPKWVTDTLLEIKEAGLLVGYPEHKHSYRGTTNYEVAVAIYAAWDYFNKIWQASISRERFVAESAPGQAVETTASLIENWKGMRKFLPEMAKLKRLATEFKSELAALGVDVPRFMSFFPRFEKYCAAYVPPKPGSKHGQFRDVPPNHWAAGAVETLRKAKILVGYPDHKFKG